MASNLIVYSNNGLNFRLEQPTYQAAAGEAAFDHQPTADELTAAFPGMAAAAAAAALPAAYAAKLAAGCAVVSLATPAISGTYAIDPASLGITTAIMAGITAGKGLPAGGATFNHLDAAGAPHAIGAADF